MQSPGTDSIASITGQQLVYGAEEGSTTEVNISVIVCTRNRGSVLDQCLQRFAWMEVPPGLSWEIVVVDNNSTDNTESVVRGFAERSGLDVRYVCERKPGGSHAHNAGIAAARGKILAFTDDDCMVDKGWMGAVAKEFESDPGLAGIGGRVESFFDIRDKPVTITTCKERHLLSLSDEFIGIIHGCNMAFTRSVFDKIGTFDVRFGPGARIVAGEDAGSFIPGIKRQVKASILP